MDLVETLKQCPEPLPDWLRQRSPGFDRKGFFSSRTVYYPGFGNDGHPVSVCARAPRQRTRSSMSITGRVAGDRPRTRPRNSRPRGS